MTRVDLHCHSTASAIAKLGVQHALGLPECATPPEEVYALAKRRGMDFVTITDHDTIDGVLSIADRPDVFVSEELTAGFRGEPQQVHVLCLGITPDDHEWLQAHSGDIEVVAAYLHEHEIACALAHPFFAVAAPLTARHRRRLAELFGIWEVRNGARDADLNLPAAVYVETHGGIGIGGTDDHAGIDIGRTYSETPHAAMPGEFLAHVRAGRVEAHGEHGSAARWAHSAMALAVRALGRGPAGPPPDPRAVLRIVERVMSESDGRGGGAPTASSGAANGVGPTAAPGAANAGAPTASPAAAADLGPDDARALLRAWLAAGRPRYCLGRRPFLPRPEASSPLRSLGRRPRHRLSPRRFARRRRSDRPPAGRRVLARRPPAPRPAPPRAPARRRGRQVDGGRGCAGGAAGCSPAGLTDAAVELFEACVPAIPYAPATAFLGREKRRIAARGDEPVRVALIADGVGSMHGVTRTLDEIRERGVPGFEVEVIGSDPHVDRRLPAVAEVEIPFYPGLHVGVPGVPAVVDALAEGRYRLLHVCAPGPAGVVAGLTGRMLGLPLAGSYHTELAAYARLRSGDPRVAMGMQLALGAFYGRCAVVLSPSAAADASLRELGIAGERIARWDRGVDGARFSPSRHEPGRFRSDRVNVLYAGRLTREKGADLLADAFLAARARDSRLHLVLAGGGPEEAAMRARLGRAATFLGWLDGDDLATAYASADVFLFCSTTDTFGQVVLEAQASGLPVVAAAAGGPAELIADGRSGLLCPPSADALGGAVAGLAGSRAMCERLARGGLAAVRERTWEASLARLADGWRSALAPEAASVSEAA